MKQNLRFLLLTLLCAVVSSAWGETVVTFTPGTDTGQTSVTKDGITVSMSTMSNNAYYQIYANESGTFSCSNGNITKIEFTCTASDKSKYGPGNASANVGTYTYSGKQGTWTGSAKNVTISSTAQVRMSSLAVTYEGSGTVSYTVTYDCNGGTSGCPDDITDLAAGTSITLAAAPTKTDYTFNGWNDGSQTYQAGGAYTVNSDVTFTAQWTSNSSQTEALLYEGFSGYSTSGESQELNINDDRLDYTGWTSFTKVYFGGNQNNASGVVNGSCGKLGTSSATGSMTASGIALTGAGTLTFKVKKYGSDTGKLNVTVDGATASGTTQVTPQDNWTDYTINLTKATGNVSITFATSSKRALIDEITLVESVPAPVIEPNGGEFAESQMVSISAKDGTIHYTTDGSDPTVESPIYENPFEITTTTTVKAIVINDGETSSVTSAIFTKVEAPVTSLNPASGYVKVGSRILVQFEGQVSKLYYSVNDGEYTEVAVTNYYPITITEDMVVDNKVKINAYHTYTLGETVLQSEIAEATYNVVNPEIIFVTPSTIFATSLDVELSASPEDAAIYYTLDGTDPTTSSTPYSAAIPLNATTTIKAIAVVEGIASAVASATYTKSEAASFSGEQWKRVTGTDDLDAVVSSGAQVIITNRVISNDGNAKVAMPSVNSSGNFDNTGVTVTLVDPGTGDNGHFVSVSDESAVAMFIVEKLGDSYRFKVKGSDTYLCALSDNKIVAKSIDNSLIEDYNATITFNDNGKEDLFCFKNSNKNNKYLRYNPPSTNKFRMYTSSTEQGVALYAKSPIPVIDLYEKPSEIDNTLTENTIEEQNGVTVNLYRSLTAGVWNAICLPFDMTEAQAKQLFGEGYALEELNDVVTDNGNTSINFKLASEFKAGVPYLVLPTQSVAKKAVIVINGVNIVADEPTEVTAGGYSFKGFYNPYNPCGSEDDFKNYFFIGANNKFQYFNSTTTQLRAFRCYFHVPEGSTPANLSLSTDNNGITESISLTEVDGLSTNLTTRVYTISGQYVGKSTENLSKGIYIVNGRKFIVK